MIIPKNLEELASYVESDQKGGFLFHCRLVSRLPVHLSRYA